MRRAVRELEPRTLASLGAVALALELVGLRTLAVRGWQPEGLGLVAATDLGLLTGVLYLTVARPHGGFGRLRLELGHAVRTLWLASSLAALLGKLIGLDMGPLWAVAPILAELTVLLMLGVLLLRWRSAPLAFDALEASLALLLPRPVVRALAVELRILGAACAALLGRPLPERGGFRAIATSQYPRLGLVLALLTLLEAPAVHLAIHALHGAGWLHAAFLFVHVYSWLWLLGDHRLLRASSHELGEQGLRLELGARACAFVPYDAIASVELAHAQPGDARITPLDAPNLRLVLSREVRVSRLLRASRAAHALALYVDDPAALKAALAQRATSARPS